MDLSTWISTPREGGLPSPEGEGECSRYFRLEHTGFLLLEMSSSFTQDLKNKLGKLRGVACVSCNIYTLLGSQTDWMQTNFHSSVLGSPPHHAVERELTPIAACRRKRKLSRLGRPGPPSLRRHPSPNLLSPNSKSSLRVPPPSPPPPHPTLPHPPAPPPL